MKKTPVDACITIPESVTADKWVNIQKVYGGLYAFRKCEIEYSDSENIAAITRSIRRSFGQDHQKTLREVRAYG